MNKPIHNNHIPTPSRPSDVAYDALLDSLRKLAALCPAPEGPRTQREIDEDESAKQELLVSMRQFAALQMQKLEFGQ